MMLRFFKKFPIVLFVFHFFGIFSMTECLMVYCLEGEGLINLERQHIVFQVDNGDSAQPADSHPAVTTASACESLLHIPFFYLNSAKKKFTDLLALLAACAAALTALTLTALCPAKSVRQNPRSLQPPAPPPGLAVIRSTILLV